jgi:glycosyltransferase involved in cell wall biosynthesis
MTHDASTLAAQAQTAILALLGRRLYGRALAQTRLLPQGPSRWRLERRILARAGRFVEAAEAGRRLLRIKPEQEAAHAFEDRWRLAQILTRAGQPGAAFKEAAESIAMQAGPEPLAPLMEAMLLQPTLAQAGERLLIDSARQATASAHPTAPALPPYIHLPQRLPYYRPFAGAHPFVMGWANACRGLPLRLADAHGGNPMAAASDAWPRLRQAVARLEAALPGLARRDSAFYAVSRLGCLLYPAPGACLDLFSMAVMGLQERPFVLVHDYLPVLFQPLAAYETCRFAAGDGLWRIVKHSLEDATCRAVIVTYPSSAAVLAHFFDSPVLYGKCTYIRPAADFGRPLRQAPPRAIEDGRRARTLLFASSHAMNDETFYARGGVDALCAFLALAETRPDLRLFLRAPLPASLDPSLKRRIARHPRIEHWPSPLDDTAYQRLLAETDLFLLPAVTAYRNGLVEALKQGIPPIVSDGAHMTDLIENGVNGLIVPGRSHRSGFVRDGHFGQDWRCILASVAAPVDPTFFAGYKKALARVIDDPALFARLRQGALATARQHDASAADIDTFASVVRCAAGL